MTSSSPGVMPFHLQYLDQNCLGVGNWSRLREALPLGAEAGAVVKDESVAIG